MKIGDVEGPEHLGVHTAVVIPGDDGIHARTDQPFADGLDFFRFQASHVTELQLDRVAQDTTGRILFGHSQFQGHFHLFTVTGIGPRERHRASDQDRFSAKAGPETIRQINRLTITNGNIFFLLICRLLLLVCGYPPVLNGV